MQGRARVKSVSSLLGRPDPPRVGRERIVSAAIELFYAHGFQAVSLDQIIARAGVTKTTFYKHFEAKDDLMLAAVQRRDEWEWDAWGRAVRKLGGEDPAAQLLAFFDVADTWFNDPDFHGCMFLNTTVEFPNPHDPVHEAAAAHKRRTRDLFRDLARSTGVSEPESFADAFTALFEGMLVLRHSHGRDDAARAIRPAAEKLLGDAVTRGPRSRAARRAADGASVS